jgi:hypothetical protein
MALDAWAGEAARDTPACFNESLEHQGELPSCCVSLPFARLRGLTLCLTRSMLPVLQANIFLCPQLSLYIRASIFRLPF